MHDLGRSTSFSLYCLASINKQYQKAAEPMYRTKTCSNRDAIAFFGDSLTQKIYRRYQYF